MKVGITADYDGSINIDDLLFDLIESIPKYFVYKNYGNNEVEIFMVIICYPKELKLRKKYDAKEKVLYWDVMLNYTIIEKVKKGKKKSIIANSIISSFDILDNYKKLNLNKSRLQEDVNSFFLSIGWIK
ncbi:MAG: hypothetical protein ABIP35_01155 [Ginsengibacter sp.]